MRAENHAEDDRIHLAKEATTGPSMLLSTKDGLKRWVTCLAMFQKDALGSTEKNEDLMLLC